MKPPNRLRNVLQAESSECGLACLAAICAAHGRSEGLTDLRRRFPVSLTGASLKSIMTIADALGFATRAVRCELDELSRLEKPCILHWNLDHYVVLNKVTRREVIIADPGMGLRKLPLQEVSKHFTGVALELTPAPNFEKRKAREKVEIRDLWSRLSGYYPVIMQLFFLAFLMQSIGLLMPIVNEIVVDDVMGRGDKDLLTSVLIGFGCLALIQTAIDLLRGYIQLHAGQKLSIQLSGNLLKHLLRLPTDFFERRHVGDILSRFGSLTPVQSFLTSGATSAALDMIMAVPAAVIMVAYSPLLSALVLFDVVLILVVRFVTFGRNRRYAEEAMTLGAKTQSIFLETVRAVRSIKIAGRETERHSIWQNATADQQNLSYRQSVFTLWGQSGFSLVQSAQGLLMLFLGAGEVIAGHLSLGMFMAFQSYALQFSSRCNSLIGSAFTFRMLGLHLERLGDVVHAEQEAGLDQNSMTRRTLNGSIEIRGMSFRYAPQDPWVLRDVNLSISAGERIALIGESGGGKSTLLKLLIGLYTPVDGEVLVDGMPMRTFGCRNFREQIGVVMQDDQLLSGTIADNIAFFDAQIDMDRIEEVCRIAHIHEDILRLPMDYHSLVGDMGSVLSGGQKQRLLLARALYRGPRVLFMDEGTANLDAALESAILDRLKELGITQVVVAHRPAAIAFAERIFQVSKCLVTDGKTNRVGGEEAA